MNAEETTNVIDGPAVAEAAGLHYVSDEDPGITRKRSGKGFAYHYRGKLVTDTATLQRAKSLAVPPAYTAVWICPDPRGHIQATGRDDRGRKQYRYHPDWTRVRDEAKYERMLEFGQALQEIRARVDADMARRGLPREKVLATIVHLLETTLIRVGNEDYAKENKSYGLTTLRNKHVAVDGGELRFNFKGKSGKMWRLAVKDRRVAKVVRACQELPGQHLFQYRSEDGGEQSVGSNDVNAYLKEITGQDFTAKDFRTWAGTVLAAKALAEFEKFDTNALAKKNVRAAIETVSARLGNTPTVCRKCYVHPEVLKSYMDGELMIQVKSEVETEMRSELAAMKPEEAAVLAFLEKRLSQDIREQKRAA